MHGVNFMHMDGQIHVAPRFFTLLLLYYYAPSCIYSPHEELVNDFFTIHLPTVSRINFYPLSLFITVCELLFFLDHN